MTCVLKYRALVAYTTAEITSSFQPFVKEMNLVLNETIETHLISKYSQAVKEVLHYKLTLVRYVLTDKLEVHDTQKKASRMLINIHTVLEYYRCFHL